MIVTKFIHSRVCSASKTKNRFINFINSVIHKKKQMKDPSMKYKYFPLTYFPWLHDFLQKLILVSYLTIYF